MEGVSVESRADSVASSEKNTDDVLLGIPDHIKERLLQMSSQLEVVESTVEQIETYQNSGELALSGLTSIQQARFNWINLYAINSLYFVYLKSNGLLVNDHPLMTELARIRNYSNRIKEVSDAEERKNARVLKIDKESSDRIVKRSLWSHAIKQDQRAEAAKLASSKSATPDEATTNKRTKFDD